MTSRLFIAAKAPRPLVAKTRLGAEIGHERAARIYAAFLRDLGRRFASFPHQVGWFVPAGAWPEILAALGPGWSGAPVVHQHGPDWTQRQRRLFLGAPGRGEDRTVLIASDSPQVRASVVAAAFARLDTSDVVLGPVLDGGYYLIGVSGGRDVLDSVTMSQGDVTGAIVRRCQELDLRHSLVEPSFDVDVADDLEGLRLLAGVRPDLAATRAALQ